MKTKLRVAPVLVLVAVLALSLASAAQGIEVGDDCHAYGPLCYADCIIVY
jgi:hypothetical protein